MKTMILAAVATLSLAVGAAYAQGVPAGGDFQAPIYGSQAFSDHRNDKEVHFLGQGTVFAKIFGHSHSDQVAADRTAPLKATSARGG
jgi:hypothetical protein